MSMEIQWQSIIFSKNTLSSSIAVSNKLYQPLEMRKIFLGSYSNFQNIMDCKETCLL